MENYKNERTMTECVPTCGDKKSETICAKFVENRSNIQSATDMAEHIAFLMSGGTQSNKETAGEPTSLLSEAIIQGNMTYGLCKTLSAILNALE